MEFVIITGMSGAGKTSALRVLEDIGYYCVDNIPAALLSTLYTLCSKSGGTDMSRVAVVVDVRGTENYDNTNLELEEFKKAHENVKILFLDASTEIIILRFKETRRRHPLADRLKGGSVMDGPGDFYAQTFRMYSLFSRIAAWLFAGGVISIALDLFLRMVKRKCSMGI